MNGRKLTVLTALAGVLAVGEFGSSIIIWQEDRPGSLPLAAVVFGVFFLIATWLLRSGRVRAGARHCDVSLAQAALRARQAGLRPPGR